MEGGRNRDRQHRLLRASRRDRGWGRGRGHRLPRGGGAWGCGTGGGGVGGAPGRGPGQGPRGAEGVRVCECECAHTRVCVYVCVLACAPVAPRTCGRVCVRVRVTVCPCVSVCLRVPCVCPCPRAVPCRGLRRGRRTRGCAHLCACPGARTSGERAGGGGGRTPLVTRRWGGHTHTTHRGNWALPLGGRGAAGCPRGSPPPPHCLPHAWGVPPPPPAPSCAAVGAAPKGAAERGGFSALPTPRAVPQFPHWRRTRGNGLEAAGVCV